ncbi:phosphonopyruvate decarboxylase [Lentimicrobium sp. S6]|uniref:phosphonopyruvate decarboxylase n=1 Tax=Lentimicrobium sp. S6 TaxID=2735872 RepID=UPI0015548FF5|nr:phosphonopyruvate decarboxylase [Lentimicrobium sp. S6]NPD45457.1 phosphonopyruvate decarboxylase [Lentimicrobium sp. S6]
MIKPSHFYNFLIKKNISFFTGVPDSLLKDICAYITDNTSAQNHIIAANEGNAIALAAGYHMATNKIPMVYMQNSGIGNAVNPLLSLTDEEVYKIPLLMMIGWRGEKKDEPQHIKQGKVTADLLDAMKIPYLILDDDEQKAQIQLEEVILKINETNTAFAIIIRKGTFEKYSIKNKLETNYSLLREDAIKIIVNQLSGDELIVSTTGKTSRELFEYRVEKNQKHNADFLTVGSMGHASQIALGIALNKPNRKIICIDGDGALLMQMGGLSIIGAQSPKNLLHIVINNGAHESVGGQPTVAFGLDIPQIAIANKYKSAVQVANAQELELALKKLTENSYPALIEILTKTGSRDNLGRPTIKPVDNKTNFMQNLAQ